MSDKFISAVCFSVIGVFLTLIPVFLDSEWDTEPTMVGNTAVFEEWSVNNLGVTVTEEAFVPRSGFLSYSVATNEVPASLLIVEMDDSCRYSDALVVDKFTLNVNGERVNFVSSCSDKINGVRNTQAERYIDDAYMINELSKGRDLVLGNRYRYSAEGFSPAMDYRIEM